MLKLKVFIKYFNIFSKMSPTVFLLMHLLLQLTDPVWSDRIAFSIKSLLEFILYEIFATLIFVIF